MPGVIIRAILEATNNVSGLVSDGEREEKRLRDDPRVSSLAVSRYLWFSVRSTIGIRVRIEKRQTDVWRDKKETHVAWEFGRVAKNMRVGMREKWSAVPGRQIEYMYMYKKKKRYMRYKSETECSNVIKKY